MVSSSLFQNRLDVKAVITVSCACVHLLFIYMYIYVS